METMYVTITVNVRSSKYLYSGPEGTADVDLKVPRIMLERPDLLNVLATLLGTAMATYDIEAAKLRTEEDDDDTTEG